MMCGAKIVMGKEKKSMADDWLKQWKELSEWEKLQQRFKWENLPNNMTECDMYRAKVPGGWLILVIYSKPQSVPVQINDESQDESYVEYYDSPPSVSTTFLPDPEHTWDGTTLD